MIITLNLRMMVKNAAHTILTHTVVMKDKNFLHRIKWTFATP